MKLKILITFWVFEDIKRDHVQKVLHIVSGILKALNKC